MEGRDIGKKMQGEGRRREESRGRGDVGREGTKRGRGRKEKI